MPGSQFVWLLTWQPGHQLTGFRPPQEVIHPFRIIIHRCIRYYFHTGEQTFKPVPCMPADLQQTLAAKIGQARRLYQHSAPQPGQQLPGQVDLQLDERQQLEAALFACPSDRMHRSLWYGPNEMQLPVKGLYLMITEELLQPLYVFQVRWLSSMCMYTCETFNLGFHLIHT